MKCSHRWREGCAQAVSKAVAGAADHCQLGESYMSYISIQLHIRPGLMPLYPLDGSGGELQCAVECAWGTELRLYLRPRPHSALESTAPWNTAPRQSPHVRIHTCHSDSPSLGGSHSAKKTWAWKAISDQPLLPFKVGGQASNKVNVVANAINPPVICSGLP